jgi:tetratricopeptide (TPR) repeat protein
MIDDDMFGDPLFDFIETELNLPERADKLRLLKNQNADLKTIVTVILCSTDYYTEAEIKGLLKMLDEVIGMPLVKRSCIKAGNYLKEQKYSKAAKEYERIINSREATQLTPEEYGDMFHNLAVAKVHITGLKEAARLFYEAYERNHREESLIQYLTTLLMNNNEEEYLNKVKEYQIGPELDHKIRNYLDTIGKEADLSEEILELREIKTQGDQNEFYGRIEEIIACWKIKVRQS